MKVRELFLRYVFRLSACPPIQVRVKSCTAGAGGPQKEASMLLKHTKTIGLIIAFVLSVSTAQPARDHYGALSSKQYGYNFGYQDGYQFGRDSVARGAPYDYRSEDFRYANRGYDHSMGERDDFQHGYRDGYKAGYSDGYNGRPGRLNNGY